MPVGEGRHEGRDQDVFHGLGLYAPARALYRAMSRGHREERRLRREFFAQLVSPGDLCFDIGANVGQAMVRHKVKPGINGWAQVNGHRGETDTIEKMRARVECDLDYLRNWSLGLDLRIIVGTIRLVFFDRHAY